MSGKLSKDSSLSSILVVSLSNIGDVVLTCPVIDILLRDFPGAEIDVIVGEKAATMFEGHARIQTIVYQKRLPFPGQARWFFSLWRRRYDLIVDLRLSALPVFLPSRLSTPLFQNPFVGHMRFKHMQRLESIYPGLQGQAPRLSLVPKAPEGGLPRSRYAVLAPGAADHAKRWPAEGFVQVGQHLVDQGYALAFIGDRADAELVAAITKNMNRPYISFAGQTNLRETAYVLQQSSFAISHDSGTMHIASYLDVPTIALWGPTDLSKYGPWSNKFEVVHRSAQMSSITVGDVLNAVSQMS